MKKFLSIVIAVGVISTFVTTAFAANVPNVNVTESVSYSDNINNYEQIPVLTMSSKSYNRSFSKSSFEVEAKTNIEKARDAVLKLNLSSQGLSHVEETCLAELDELALNPECMLNEYTVLVPKARASSPSFYAEYKGRNYYSSLTSLSNITLEKNSSFGTYNNLKQWAQNGISLGLCFSSVYQVTIPWALMTASLPSRYTVHTSDWMDSYINLNPTNRAIFVKEGSKYVNVYNREFGKVRPYFVYHYNDAGSSSPAKTIYHSYTTYPDASGSTKDAMLYTSKAIYDSGANAVFQKMKNVVDLMWR